MSKKITEVKTEGGKIYEIGYHLISSIAEEQVPAEVEKLKAVLAKEKATIISEESAKLRPLAYSIKKGFGGVYKTYDKAYFGFIKFELLEGGDIAKIDAAFKSNDSVLRYIIIKTVRENTMYSPKITVFTDKDAKIKPMPTKDEKTEAPLSIEEVDKSIDALLTEDVKV